MKKAGKIFPVILLLLSLLAGSLSQGYYDSKRDYQAMRQVFLSLPAGKTIRILSFGFSNLAADLLYIWSIQFYSTFTIANRFEYIEKVFDVITDITPSYRDPYVVGAMMMVLDAREFDMALRLLEKGSLANPDEWFYDYEAGFYAYKNLKNYELAAFYYNRAAEKESAPRLIRRLAAHMIYMQDDLDTAWALYSEILAGARDDLEIHSAQNHLYQIKAERDIPVIESAIEKFRERYNRAPKELSELLQTGFLTEIPENYYGKEYIYDAEKGMIDRKQVFRWKK